MKVYFRDPKQGGDIASWLKKKFPNKEFHIPGYSYCGPGTNLKQRLDDNDNPRPGYGPVNEIDEACYRHDLAYRDNKDIESRQKADITLIHDLNKLNNLSLTEKFTRGLVKTAMKGKIAFGGDLDANFQGVQLPLKPPLAKRSRKNFIDR